MTKKILVTSDKFKGSVTAADACRLIGKGIRKSFPDYEIWTHPIADGGDGSIEVLCAYMPCETISVLTEDPLGRSITAEYVISNKTAFIEIAAASGFVLLADDERDPLLTSTYGTGILVKDALCRDIGEVVFLLGGSATNDAGLGIAAALGFIFSDTHGNAIKPNGGNLQSITHISNPAAFAAKFTFLTDVDNPFYGEEGAAFVYGPQKGASPAAVQALDVGLRNVASLIMEKYGLDLQTVKGAGAAGGIAGGLSPLLNGEIKNGFDTLSTVTGLEQKLAEADVVISGEGKLDRQSLRGKVVGKLASLCSKYDKDLHIIAGTNELTRKECEAMGIRSVLAVREIAASLPDAIKNAPSYIEQLGANLNLR